MFLFEKDRYFNECHAVSAIALDNGDYVASWFAGSREGNADVGIWQGVFRDGTWSVPKKIWSDEVPLWNPVLFYDEGVLYLFFKSGKTINDWESFVMKSFDQGRTYRLPEKLPEGFFGPAKNKPIKMSNGEWLCGGSMEPQWNCRMEIFSPKDNVWKYEIELEFPGEPDGRGIIQPTVWESAPGSVHALMRSSLCRLVRADSEDFGRTWNTPYKTTLPSNNSGIDLTKLADGRLVLCYNPIAENWGKRSPLILSMSSDNGQSWPRHYVLEAEEEKSDNRYSGRYSYPAIISVPDGVGCFYTHCRKQIRCQVIFVHQFVEGEFKCKPESAVSMA